MHYTKAELTALLTREDFPRSASYDPLWMLENLMGPNAVWLAESLSQLMDLPTRTRVLDLGCGKATSSIFLAQEFGLQVWATVGAGKRQLAAHLHCQSAPSGVSHSC